MVLKPDIIHKKLVDLLLAYLANSNLRIIEKYRVSFFLDTLAQFYGWAKINYPDVLGQYLCATELTAIVVEGIDAIQELLRIKKQMRSQYSSSPYENLFHCSESNNDFLREYGVLKLIATMSSDNKKSKRYERTDNQVELIVYKFIDEKPIFLLFKRTEARGGFWQPITGNVEIGESFEQAALRELREETGISKVIKLIKTGFSFDFFDDGRIQHEEVFGSEISDDAEINLSSEHSEYTLVTMEEANKLLKYPGNKQGLMRLYELLKTKKDGG
ncbi:MAG: NUDIX domain-containing protein [Bacteroidota bacterium]